MAIDDFIERHIARQILNKLKPERLNSRGKHRKCYIYIDGVLVAKVKIPNDHNRIMKENKSQYIAKNLKLDDNDFNDLINCPLSGPNYYKKIKNKLEY